MSDLMRDRSRPKFVKEMPEASCVLVTVIMDMAVKVAGQLSLKSSPHVSQLGLGSTRPGSTRPGVDSIVTFEQ